MFCSVDGAGAHAEAALHPLDLGIRDENPAGGFLVKEEAALIGCECAGAR
jgi:hypothetical protein